MSIDDLDRSAEQPMYLETWETCPDCGGKVSTMAEMCPHCGRLRKPREERRREEQNRGNHRNQTFFDAIVRFVCWIFGSGVMVFLFLYGFVVGLKGENSWLTRNWHWLVIGGSVIIVVAIIVRLPTVIKDLEDDESDDE